MVDTVLELSVPARVRQVGALRRAANAFLEALAPEGCRYQILLVISELCTNAVQASGDKDLEFTLRLRNQDDRIVVEVEDRGPGFARAMQQIAVRDEDEGGRGIQVVQALVDELSIERSVDRTTVRCVVFKDDASAPPGKKKSAAGA